MDKFIHHRPPIFVPKPRTLPVNILGLDYIVPAPVALQLAEYKRTITSLAVQLAEYQKTVAQREAQPFTN